MAQCVIPRKNSLIIIDEPETHIHKAILKTLWDEIEAARPDCSFIYITHDLDFAQSRVNARKFCLHSYQQNTPQPPCWDIQEVEEVEGFSEDFVLKLLGSKKPVLFVEGEATKSYDQKIYSVAYPDFTVVSSGSCGEIIRDVKALNSNPQLNRRVQCFGLIDRDDRETQSIESLEKDNVFCLPFSEVENLLLKEEILSQIIPQMHSYDDLNKDLNVIIEDIKQLVFSQAEKQINKLAQIYENRKGYYEVQKINRNYNKPEQRDEKIRLLRKVADDLEKDILIGSRRRLIQSLIDTQNYESLIEIIDCKELNLLRQISRTCLNSTDKGYAQEFLKSLKTNPETVQTLKTLLPRIPITPSQ